MPNVTVFDDQGNPISVILRNDDIQDIAFTVWRQTLVVIPMIAIPFYDYVVTLPEEINTLWRRKKSLASVALLLNRYALLVYALALVALLLPVTGNPLVDSRCNTVYGVGGVSILILIMSSIVFDSLRIYAIMQGNIWAGLGVGAFGIAWLILDIMIPNPKGIVVIFTNGALLGCQGSITVETYNRHTVLSWTYARDAVNITFEALVLSLTLFKTLGLKRTAATLGIRTSLNDLLVHDGSLQFGFILLLSVLDIVLIATVGEPVTTIVIKSIVTSHMAFHLRQIYLEPKDATRSLASISLRFNSNIVGNAGAPLHSMLLDSHDDIEVEQSNVQYSDDPMAALVHRARRNTFPNLTVQDEERQDEAESLLLCKEDGVRDDLSILSACA